MARNARGNGGVAHSFGQCFQNRIGILQVILEAMDSLLAGRGMGTDLAFRCARPRPPLCYSAPISYSPIII